MPHLSLPELADIVRNEIKQGQITEAYIHDPAFFVAGMTEGQRVTINPVPDTADVCIHEMLHRHFPHWSESYVRLRTRALLRYLGDDGIRRLCRLYDKVKKPGRAKSMEDAG
ncbi:MAG: hypothetical protein PHR30_16605 [Gallionellaceae bacterium]|nr:hypothetical protein [Gallionellaceae bacterium]